MIANLLTYKKTAIVIGLCLATFIFQAARIKALKSTRDNLKANIVTLNQTITNYKEAQTTNLEAITTLQEANQQCALGKQINEEKANTELTRHEGVIAVLNNKYEKLRNTKKTTGCSSQRIDADLLDQLQNH